ncbi:transketolase family protein [Segetibacter aerophilus]|uniref:1-deoxy-D-xylulose-5-phosphate synthase n=1 Tax=Segetibacter aerophilus TaxID=670293 RepID=A0A512BI28_9BACT|nr:transketolase C-terminal domain-containing protein [Segetibacter aerophilus]GEO11618.1 1-deoxy-D-xylulose-5-phosphate synthase [Segetibacter aerophilus]
MRTAFINQLIEEARKNDRVFLIVGDLGFSVVEPFVQEFPERYLNVGVAEQNMAGFAAGLALEGYCVFIYSIGNFPTLRCMEQIRYDICYHDLNVKIIAVGGGYSYGALGPSHHATEEIGMLRTIPNIVVCAPGDPLESQRITTFCTNHIGPCYVRLGKAGEPVVHEDLAELSIGDIIEVKQGKNTAVFSTGSMLKYVCDFVNDNDLNASIYSFPFVKPINKSQLKEILESYQSIITIEEHQSQGGFGSAILEQANDLLNEGSIKALPKIKRIAINDKFYSIAGSQKYLREAAGLVLEKFYF